MTENKHSTFTAAIASLAHEIYPSDHHRLHLPKPLYWQKRINALLLYSGASKPDYIETRHFPFHFRNRAHSMFSRPVLSLFTSFPHPAEVPTETTAHSSSTADNHFCKCFGTSKPVGGIVSANFIFNHTHIFRGSIFLNPRL